MSSHDVSEPPPAEQSSPAAKGKRLHDLARRAVASKQPVLQLPPGEHRVNADLLPDTLVWISNNDGGVKNVLLDFTGAADLTIEGNGCKLLLEGTVIPVLLGGCRNVTLRNLSIDWVRPGFTEVEVTASGTGFVEFDGAGQLDVDRGRLIALGGGHWPSWHLFNLVAFDRARREPLAGTGENWNLERTHRAASLGGGRIRLEADLDSPPPAGGPAVVMHGDRVAPAVVIDRSDGITLEDVTIHHALGMGVIAQVSRNLMWRRVRVVPSGGRLFTTWVDATHAVDCSGFLRMQDCEFRGMFDDGTNIHGVYHRSGGWPDAQRLLLETMHHQQWGVSFVRAGDTVRLSDPATLTPLEDAVVREVRQINGRFHELEFDKAPSAARGRACVAHRYDPDFEVEITGTTISQHRGRGLLLSVPGKVRVRGNTLHSSGVGILAAAEASYWWESGPARDLIVEGNTFDACGYAMCGEKVLVVEAPPGETPLHGSVVFRDNDVRLARPVMIEANRVGSLRIGGNRVSSHPDYPWTGRWSPLQAAACREVIHDLPADI